MKKDTGYKTLLRASKEYFEKWGQYMKRANIAERKCDKLKQLLLLTDPAVSDVQMNDLTMRQWQEFITEFPDEGSK